MPPTCRTPPRCRTPPADSARRRAPDATYSCVWPHARDSTASRQLSEVKQVPAQLVLRWVTTLEPWVLNIFAVDTATGQRSKYNLRDSNLSQCEAPPEQTKRQRKRNRAALSCGVRERHVANGRPPTTSRAHVAATDFARRRAPDATYSCVWPHARDSTASRQLSEVKQCAGPAQYCGG